jgi:hypothetical protein
MESSENELEMFIEKLTEDDEFDTIHSLIPLISGNIQYALVNNYSPKLKRLIHVLFESITDDTFCFDRFNYLLKKIEIDNFNREAVENIHQIYADLYLKMIFICIRQLGNTPNNSDDNSPNGVNIALILLNRLSATFQSSLILLRFGFHIEAEMLFRVIVEQIAYIYTCYKIDDYNEIDKIEPNKCIKCIKKKYKLLGGFYGELSDSIHFRTKSFPKILSVKDNKVGTNIRSGKKSKKNYLYLFYLSCIYLDICKEIDEKYIHSDYDFDNSLKLASHMFGEFRDKLKKELNV